MSVKDLIKDEKVLEKLVRTDLRIISSKFKSDSGLKYLETKKRVFNKILLFFSATLITFLLNYSTLKSLSTEFAVLWSIIFFTFSVFTMTFKYLGEEVGGYLRDLLMAPLDDFLDVNNKLINLGAEPDTLKKVYLTILKDTPVVSETLKGVRNELKKMSEDEAAKKIDQLLYGEKKPIEVFSEIRDSMREPFGEYAVNGFVKILKDIWKIKVPTFFYILGMGFFIVSFLKKNYMILLNL